MVSEKSLVRATKYWPIAWILIGLMVGGSLVDYLAAQHQAGVCTELRLLEQEDDRADISDLLFVPTHGTWGASTPRVSEEIVESPRLDIWAAQQAAHFERGPPSLVLVFA